jgi:hypothetical protein
MMRSIAFAVVFGLTTVLWSHSSFAEGALAVMLLNGDPRHGFAMGASSDKATTDEARSAALAECRRRGASLKAGECRVIQTFHDECMQDAENGDTKAPSTAVGWGFGPDRDAANRRAMEMCETMRRGAGRRCQLDGEPLCDGKARR